MKPKKIIKEKDAKLYERNSEFGYQYSTQKDFLYYFEINDLQKSILLQNGAQIPFDQIDDINVQPQYDGFNLQIIKKGSKYFLFPIVIHEEGLLHKIREFIYSKTHVPSYQPQQQSMVPPSPPPTYQQQYPQSPPTTMQQTPQQYPPYYGTQMYPAKKRSKAFKGIFIVSIIIGLIGIALISYDLQNYDNIDTVTLNATNTFEEFEIEISDENADTGYTNIEIIPNSGGGNLSAYLCEISYDNITEIKSNAIFFSKKEYTDVNDDFSGRITISINDPGTYYLYLIYEPADEENNELEVEINASYWGYLFLIGFIMAVFAAGMFLACLILYFATKK